MEQSGSDGRTGKGDGESASRSACPSNAVADRKPGDPEDLLPSGNDNETCALLRGEPGFIQKGAERAVHSAQQNAVSGKP